CRRTAISSREKRPDLPCSYRRVDRDVGAGTKVAQPLIDGGSAALPSRALPRQGLGFCERHESSPAPELRLVLAVVPRHFFIADLHRRAEALIEIVEDPQVVARDLAD